MRSRSDQQSLDASGGSMFCPVMKALELPLLRGRTIAAADNAAAPDSYSLAT